MRIFISLVLCAALIGVGLFGYRVMTENPVEAKASPRPERVPAVEVVRLALQSRQVSLTGQGRVAPARRSQLVAEVAGTVVEMAEAFEVGRHFRQGEVILSIDPVDYENALRQAEAAVIEAESALAQEIARAKQAQADWERVGDGRPASDLTLRRPQIAASRARLASAQARRDQAARNLEKCEVKAPYDCCVESTAMELGSYASPGQLIGALFSWRERELTVPLSLENYALLKRDASGKLTGGGVARLALGDRWIEWPVRVLRSTGRIAEATSSGEVVLGLEAVSAARGEEFVTPPPGAFLQVELEGRELEGVVEIPRRALREDDSVWLVEAGRLARRRVEVLRSDAERFWVRGGASGLKAGELVVVSALEVPVIGMEVQIAEAGSEEN